MLTNYSKHLSERSDQYILVNKKEQLRKVRMVDGLDLFLVLTTAYRKSCVYIVLFILTVAVAVVS